MRQSRPFCRCRTALTAFFFLACPAAADDRCDGDLSVSLDRAIFGMTISATSDGLLVGGVAEDGAASAAGLQRGDSIVAIDGQAVVFEDALAALRWADRLRAERVTEMEIVREGGKSSVSLVGRKPTCDEVRKLSQRLAGGPPIAGTEPCGSLTGKECKREQTTIPGGGEVVTAEFVRLVELGQEKGDLTLKITREPGGFAVEIVKPPGLSEVLRTELLPPELERTAVRLRGDDHALFLLKMYPPEGEGMTGYRYGIRLLEAPDYAR